MLRTSGAGRRYLATIIEVFLLVASQPAVADGGTSANAAGASSAKRAEVAPGTATNASDSFETIYRTQWAQGIGPDIQVQTPMSSAISTLKVPELGGAALRVSMKRSDDFSHIANGAPRTELNFAPALLFHAGHEYEIRWSILIPADYVFDSKQGEIITQIHQTDTFLGPPPFCLMLMGPRYQVEVRGGADRAVQTFAFGPAVADRGKAVSWTLRYRGDGTGASSFTELLRNGV